MVGFNFCAKALAGVSALLIAASASAQFGDWTSGGAGISNNRSQYLTLINPWTVGALHQKWAFTTHGDVSATPTVVGNDVYAVDWGGYLYDINAYSGVAKWSHPINDYTGNPGNLVSVIGLPITSLSRTSPAVDGNTLVLGDQGLLDTAGVGMLTLSNANPYINPAGTASVIAVNAATGKRLWRTTVETHWEAAITSSPVIYNGTVYVGVCSLEEGIGELNNFPYQFFFRGSVVALDEKTGAIKWRTLTTYPGLASDGTSYAGCSIWGSTPVVDVLRNSLYIATGNNYDVPTGSPEQVSGILTPGNHVDSVLALDLKTGNIKWSTSPRHVADTWNAGNIYGYSLQITKDPGPDYDFGSGPTLYTTVINGRLKQVVGAGEKSGQYWALDPDTGATLWGTQVGPGGTAGGIEWGSATDGARVYVSVSNSNFTPFVPRSGGPAVTSGLFAGLDAATGKYLWQTPDPSGGHDFGMASVAGGVMFGGSMSGMMYALDASNGKVLWSFNAGSSVNCGAAVTLDSVYWGSGYGRFFGAFGTPGDKLYAFSLF